MLKSFKGYNVPFYVVMLKYAGFTEVFSLDELESGTFFHPIDYQLIVSEKTEGDVSALFSNFDNTNINLIRGDNSSKSGMYLLMMLNRIPEKINKANLNHFVTTHGRN